MQEIAYGTDERHKLDLYTPRGAGPYPVVIFVHGGGWREGDKRLYTHLGSWLSHHGILCVIPNYRLTVPHPSHVEDVATAVGWVRDNIAGFGGDIKRLYLTGYSAGGHLAALLALDPRYLGAVGLSPSIFRGVVTYSGVYRIDWTIFLFSYRKVFSWFGRKKASPETYVNRGAPPWVVIYATRDYLTLDLQAKRFYNKLVEAGCKARLMVFDSDHPLLTENMVETEEAMGLIHFFRDTVSCSVPEGEIDG